MNSWGSEIIYFLVFISTIGGCVNDEVSRIQLKEPDNKRLNIKYEESKISSGILRVDSIHTGYNQLLKSGKRLMAGRYVDDKFGAIKAQAYTEFQPDNRTVKIEKTAKLISGFLILSFDYYRYGAQDAVKSTFTVHELTEKINPNKNNFSNSKVKFAPTPLGTASYGIDGQRFDKQRKLLDSIASLIKINEMDSLVIALDNAFISKLFKAAQDQSDDYISFAKFSTSFPGLAILPDDADTKVVGFNMDNTANKLYKSKIVLNYDVPDTVNKKTLHKKLTYSLYKQANILLNGFTQISVDRKGTPLDNGIPVYTEFNPLETRLYQSGNAIVPLVDFTRFIVHTDTIPNIIFSSVELVINVEDPGSFDPPEALKLRMLNERNRFVDATDAHNLNPATYANLIVSDEWRRLAIGSQQATANTTGSLLRLLYNKATSSYSGDFTVFFQTLRYAKDKANRPTRFGIVAQTPWLGNSVNRFRFKTDSIKIKALYAIPKASP